MNPYLTDGDVVDRILAARSAERGSGSSSRRRPTTRWRRPPCATAMKHSLSVGAELREIPGTVVHAKVVVADDAVSFGTVNLDAWALYRNSEIMMIARSRELAEQFQERLFEPDIARSRRGTPPGGGGSASRAGSATRSRTTCDARLEVDASPGGSPRSACAGRARSRGRRTARPAPSAASDSAARRRSGETCPSGSAPQYAGATSATARARAFRVQMARAGDGPQPQIGSSATSTRP